MRLSLFAAVAILGAGLSAHADTVTDIIDVNATANNGQVLSLSYSLTIDVTQNTFTPATTGLQLLSVSNTDPAYAAAFALPTEWTYWYAGGDATLMIGSDNVVPGYGIAPKTDSYFLQIFGFGGAHPYFGDLSETSADGELYGFGHDVYGSDLYNLSSYSFSITPEDAPAPVNPTTAVTPEPSSLVLLGTGLLGLMGAARRRLL